MTANPTQAPTPTTLQAPSAARQLVVGDTIGPFERESGFATWNRFAAVNSEFVPIHMDDEAGRAAGMPGAFGMGNQLVSYLHAVVREWMGESGTIERLSAQFRKPNTRGRVTAGGTVTSVAHGDTGATVQLDLWVRDADGQDLAPGTATVRLGSAG